MTGIVIGWGLAIVPLGLVATAVLVLRRARHLAAGE
jgi:hypothetical protein